MKDLHIIGWRERVDLPEWDIQGLLAKSDTGARSSAIDVASYEELPGDRVRFKVRLKRAKGEREKTRRVTARICRRSKVRSSNGQMAHRLFVRTTLRIGTVEKEVEFGLVCRKSMLCRILLGRLALSDDFLVDCTEKHLLGDG